MNQDNNLSNIRKELIALFKEKKKLEELRKIQVPNKNDNVILIKRKPSSNITTMDRAAVFIVTIGILASSFMAIYLNLLL